MDLSLQNAVVNLLHEVSTYESDTFSASYLTREEIILVTTQLIQNLADNAGCSSGFDGDDLTQIYNQIQDQKEAN